MWGDVVCATVTGDGGLIQETTYKGGSQHCQRSVGYVIERYLGARHVELEKQMR